MKIVQRVLMVFFIVVIVILFTYPLIIAETWNIDSGKGSSLGVFVNNVVDSVKNGKNYDKYVKKFVEEQFGEVVSVKLDISIGTRANNNTYTYMVRFNDVLSKNFNICVNSNGGCYSDISDILSEDPKFQHLYSEWVKKQVGIYDENIEINFKEAVKGSRWVGEKPYIEFSNINSIDDLEEDICKNTHNLYVYKVEISNFNSLNVEDVLTVVKRYERLLKPYVFSDGDNVLWFGVKLNDSINDKDDPYRYGILFDYNNNEKKYYKYYEKRPIENNISAYIEFD